MPNSGNVWQETPQLAQKCPGRQSSASKVMVIYFFREPANICLLCASLLQQCTHNMTVEKQSWYTHAYQAIQNFNFHDIVPIPSMLRGGL
eukprot:433809-Amphidinium_carterae.2